MAEGLCTDSTSQSFMGWAILLAEAERTVRAAEARKLIDLDSRNFYILELVKHAIELVYRIYIFLYS